MVKISVEMTVYASTDLEQIRQDSRTQSAFENAVCMDLIPM